MKLPSQIKALILDMDGVLWRSEEAIGDLAAIITRMETLKLKYVFATNNATLSPEAYVDKLKGFNVKVTSDRVLTSAICVAKLLSQKFPSGGPVFVIGESGLIQALQEKNFTPVSIEDTGKAQAVVVGLDRLITFDKMREATLLVNQGIPFYGSNPDKTFPTPRGEIPGAGAWISVISTATGIEPIYAGKPYPQIVEMALERLGTSRNETLVVGDRLETDVAAGQAAGCFCALVLSGVSTRDQADRWLPPPDFIANDLTQLLA
jgi:4-nitrophenyl phosphatase